MSPWRKSSYSNTGGCVELAWRKSSFSNTGDCVELAWSAARDSKNVSGPTLTFAPDQLGEFIGGAKAGRFDLRR